MHLNCHVQFLHWGDTICQLVRSRVFSKWNLILTSFGDSMAICVREKLLGSKCEKNVVKTAWVLACVLAHECPWYTHDRLVRWTPSKTTRGSYVTRSQWTSPPSQLGNADIFLDGFWMFVISSRGFPQLFFCAIMPQSLLCTEDFPSDHAIVAALLQHVDGQSWPLPNTPWALLTAGHEVRMRNQGTSRAWPPTVEVYW